MATIVDVPIKPVYSHGGQSGVSGAANGGGRAVAIFRAAGFWPPAFYLRSTGAMTVDIEVHPGPPQSDGTFTEADWMSVAQQVFASAGIGTPVAIPPTFPYVRSKISSYSDGTLESCVPCIPLPNGDMVSAQYITMKAGGNV